MFNHLIESTSHAREFKRRGSFVLFTFATYALLFVVAGVASIYAYDARLEDQSLDVVVMLPPVDFPNTPVKPVTEPPKNGGSKLTEITRAIAMDRVDNPNLVPDKTSVTPNKNESIPKGVPYKVTGVDSGAIVPSGDGHSNTPGNGSGTTAGSIKVDVGTPPVPPDPPERRVVPKIVSKGPITGLALVLPKPPYPPLARQARAHGPVNVQVLIDETGKVISAKAVSGNPMLMGAAQQAAYGARFSPTRLGEQAVKVSGVITYNFVLQ